MTQLYIKIIREERDITAGPTKIMTGTGEYSNIHMLRVSDIDDIDFSAK